MKLPDYIIKVMCEACREMAIIRARDGVPKGSNVTQEYWNDIINRLNCIVTDATGHSAYCHPSLYKDIRELSMDAHHNGHHNLYRM